MSPLWEYIFKMAMLYFLSMPGHCQLFFCLQFYFRTCIYSNLENELRIVQNVMMRKEKVFKVT